MSRLATTAAPAIAAGASLLFADDADAGFLTPGVRGARDKVNYQPGAKGDQFLRLGVPNAPDGMGLSTNDRLDTLIGALEGMNERDQLKFFTNYIHHKANYEAWGKEMLAADGARSGDAYKAGLDAFLEDIIERRPVLGPLVTRYAMDGDRGRLSRTSDQAQRQENARRSRGRHFNHGATRRPRRRAVAAPMQDGLLAAQLADREERIAEHMTNLGVERDPRYDYGSLLPIKKDVVTGAVSPGVPNLVSDIARGVIGLGMTPQTGIYDPNDFLNVSI